jgi:hypothetical protein
MFKLLQLLEPGQSHLEQVGLVCKFGEVAGAARSTTPLAVVGAVDIPHKFSRHHHYLQQ